MPITPHSQPQPQATTNLLSVSVNLLFLDPSYKWNHMICGLLCLASFTYLDFFFFFLEIHPCCGMCQYFYLIHFTSLVPYWSPAHSRYTVKGQGLSHGNQKTFQNESSYEPKKFQSIPKLRDDWGAIPHAHCQWCEYSNLLSNPWLYTSCTPALNFRGVLQIHLLILNYSALIPPSSCFWKPWWLIALQLTLFLQQWIAWTSWRKMIFQIQIVSNYYHRLVLLSPLVYPFFIYWGTLFAGICMFIVVT